jgi:hypothetical protein
MVDKGIQLRPGTLRIAMSTCVRDKNNHNSLRHASQILQIMLQTLEDVDAKAVGMYADLAITFPLAKGQDLIDALTHLHPIVKNLRLQLGVGGATRDSDRVGATYLRGAERQDALTTIRKIYGVYDRLLLSDLIPEEQKQDFKKERARLSAFIQKQTEVSERSAISQKNREMNKELQQSEGDADLHQYLNEPGEGEEKDEKRAQAKTHERRTWQAHNPNETGGNWRTRNVKPEGQRKPWSSDRKSSSRY